MGQKIGRRNPFPFRAWHTIRGRVAIVLAVPTCLLLALTGLEVSDRAADWREAHATADRVSLLLDVQDLVRELQRERGLTNGLLGGADEYRGDLSLTRDRTDADYDALLGASTAVDKALRELASLDTLRHAVDDGSASRADALDFYTNAITALNDVLSADHHASDRQLGLGLDAMRSLADATESLALERGLLNGAFAAGSFTDEDFTDFSEALASRESALSDFAQFATAEQQEAVDAAFATDAAERTAQFERQAQDGADGSQLGVDPADWWEAASVVVDDLHNAQERVGADIQQRAEELSGNATRQLAGFVGLGLSILALVVALVWLSARSITQPLDALAREAKEVAGRWLPEAVRAIQEAEPDAVARLLPAMAGGHDREGGSAEEVTRLAAALRDVERAAVELAAEQAALRRNNSDSLANLGHRNARLLRRQLRLITALESQEMDPDALGGLFELDHLATRMQRNAESLLILTGEQSPPRVWPGVVPVSDVARSAIAEVEDYRRVTMPDMERCMVHGWCVAELSHLLAELIENALRASPRGQLVEVTGWQDGREYCLAIVDRGRGMTQEELATANARLGGRDSFLVAPTGHLGHYVVGKLAARLGALVEVRHTGEPEVGGGVSAFVALPPHLIGGESQPASPGREPLIPAGAGPVRT